MFVIIKKLDGENLLEVPSGITLVKTINDIEVLRKIKKNKNI